MATNSKHINSLIFHHFHFFSLMKYLKLTRGKNKFDHACKSKIIAPFIMAKHSIGEMQRAYHDKEGK